MQASPKARRRSKCKREVGQASTWQVGFSGKARVTQVEVSLISESQAPLHLKKCYYRPDILSKRKRARLFLRPHHPRIDIVNIARRVPCNSRLLHGIVPARVHI